MKRAMVGAAMLLVAGVGAAWAGPKPAASGMTKKDRNALVSYLQKTQKGVDAAVKGLSAEQWKWKAAPERWSVEETLEHITLAEDFLRALITDRVLKTPAAPDKENAEKQAQGDAQVLKVNADRSVKAQAPEPLRPTGKWADPKALLAEFKARRAKTIELVKSSPEDFRAHFMDSLVIKDMDAVQWVYFLAAHSERHTAQMLEVKATAGFPKK